MSLEDRTRLPSPKSGEYPWLKARVESSNPKPTAAKWNRDTTKEIKRPQAINSVYANQPYQNIYLPPLTTTPI